MESESQLIVMVLLICNSHFQVPPRQQTKTKEMKEKAANNNGASSPDGKPASPMRGRAFEVSSPDLKLHHNRLLDSFHTQVGFRMENTCVIL